MVIPYNPLTLQENKGGATGRPEPKDVWAQVKDKI